MWNAIRKVKAKKAIHELVSCTLEKFKSSGNKLDR
jgi:hypothetical protein